MKDFIPSILYLTKWSFPVKSILRQFRLFKTTENIPPTFSLQNVLRSLPSLPPQVFPDFPNPSQWASPSLHILHQHPSTHAMLRLAAGFFLGRLSLLLPPPRGTGFHTIPRSSTPGPVFPISMWSNPNVLLPVFRDQTVLLKGLKQTL